MSKKLVTDTCHSNLEHAGQAVEAANPESIKLQFMRRISMDSVSESYVFGTSISLSPSTSYDFDESIVDLMEDIEDNVKVLQALCRSLEDEEACLLLKSLSNIENGQRVDIPILYLGLPSENGQFLQIKVSSIHSTLTARLLIVKKLSVPLHEKEAC